MKSIEGKLAMVTGASQGIGLAISEQLAKEGATVVMVALGEDVLHQAAEAINQRGGQAIAEPCDLMNSNFFIGLHHRLVAEHGSIDILVNNVGVGTFKPAELTSRQEAEMPVQLPFGIAVTACHTVIPGMLAKGAGHIVNITSPAGFFHFPNMAYYAASRHAMIGLSHCLHEELAPKGIGVSLVCPGQVNTRYFERNDADMNYFPKISKYFPVLEPHEVGEAVSRAIHENLKELILPKAMEACIRSYQKAPRLMTSFLKSIGLYKPIK